MTTISKNSKTIGTDTRHFIHWITELGGNFIDAAADQSTEIFATFSKETHISSISIQISIISSDPIVWTGWGTDSSMLDESIKIGFTDTSISESVPYQDYFKFRNLSQLMSYGFLTVAESGDNKTITVHHFPTNGIRLTKETTADGTIAIPQMVIVIPQASSPNMAADPGRINSGDVQSMTCTVYHTSMGENFTETIVVIPPP